LRSILRLFCFLPFVASTSFAIATGCASSNDAGLSGPSAKPGDTPFVPGPQSGGTDLPKNDAAAAAPLTFHGSPLCKAGPKTCMPDDDGPKPASLIPSTCDIDGGASACRVDVDPDAGSGSTGTAPGAGPPVAPTSCPGLADPRGTDGVECRRGSDCARGFDCIVENGKSFCRHYCCAGSCENHLSKNGSATFCDIQTPIDHPAQQVPVCMPIKTCHLLMPGECADQETCAVVTEAGDTGCVTIGPQQDGQLCDTQNCIAGWTCLGNAGERRCYQLCTVDGNECKGGKECTTGSVFQDNTYGVCQAPSP
jgi:hypothetical protein